MTVVGFTGTRRGLTAIQCVRIEAGLRRLMAAGPVVALHGDCVGADAGFDSLCRSLGIETTCRPGTNRALRAFTGAREIARPESSLARNRKIVADAAHMIAGPAEMTEQLRSGTWATIREARRQGRPLSIVWPTGACDTERS